jgi:predicted RNA-binding protein
MKVQEEVHSMCEANAYMVAGEDQELVMEAVDTITPDPGGIRLTSIFGDQKILKARIHSLSLVDHKIFLEKEA